MKNGGLGKKRSGEGPKTEKDKTERATRLGRRTREKIQKSGIKLTALRFQTGVRHQNRRPPFSSKNDQIDRQEVSQVTDRQTRHSNVFNRETHVSFRQASQ